MSFQNSLGGMARLEHYGMHFDDLNRIRVLDESTASQVSSFTKFENSLHLKIGL